MLLLHRNESPSLLTRKAGTIFVMIASGPLLCLLSGAAFGAMGVFGKLAYAEGVTVGTLLSVRFVLAAAVLWLVVTLGGRTTRRAAAPASGCRPTFRVVLAACALGAVVYAAQAGAYFAALARLEAGLLALIVFAYPALVVVLAALVGRERADLRRLLALAVASGGLVLLLAGAGTEGRFDAAGLALGAAAATIYGGYLLAGEELTRRLEPLRLAALICTGAGASLTSAALVAGQLRLGAVSAAGWLWLVCVSLVCTVAAIALLLAGLRRAGPTTGAIASTGEPVMAVVLAAAVFGEQLTHAQLLGGALVLAAVAVIQLHPTRQEAVAHVQTA